MAGLSLIKKLGISGLQYNALSSLAESELSANAIIASLKGTEAAINRAKGLQAIRELRGVISTRPYVTSVNYNARLNPDRLPYALTDQKREYSFRAELRVLNANTGEFETVVRNLSSSELLTKQEAIDRLQEMFADTASTSGVEFDSAVITQVTRQLPE